LRKDPSSCLGLPRRRLAPKHGSCSLQKDAPNLPAYGRSPSSVEQEEAVGHSTSGSSRTSNAPPRANPTKDQGATGRTRENRQDAPPRNYVSAPVATLPTERITCRFCGSSSSSFSCWPSLATLAGAASLGSRAPAARYAHLRVVAIRDDDADQPSTLVVEDVSGSGHYRIGRLTEILGRAGGATAPGAFSSPPAQRYVNGLIRESRVGDAEPSRAQGVDPEESVRTG
jgi:hypothetical protein